MRRMVSTADSPSPHWPTTLMSDSDFKRRRSARRARASSSTTRARSVTTGPALPAPGCASQRNEDASDRAAPPVGAKDDRGIPAVEMVKARFGIAQADSTLEEALAGVVDHAVSVPH